MLLMHNILQQLQSSAYPAYPAYPASQVWWAQFNFSWYMIGLVTANLKDLEPEETVDRSEIYLEDAGLTQVSPR